MSSNTDKILHKKKTAFKVLLKRYKFKNNVFYEGLNFKLYYPPLTL